MKLYKKNSLVDSIVNKLMSIFLFIVSLLLFKGASEPRVGWAKTFGHVVDVIEYQKTVPGRRECKHECRDNDTMCLIQLRIAQNKRKQRARYIEEVKRRNMVKVCTTLPPTSMTARRLVIEHSGGELGEIDIGFSTKYNIEDPVRIEFEIEDPRNIELCCLSTQLFWGGMFFLLAGVVSFFSTHTLTNAYRREKAFHKDTNMVENLFQPGAFNERVP